MSTVRDGEVSGRIGDVEAAVVSSALSVELSHGTLREALPLNINGAIASAWGTAIDVNTMPSFNFPYTQGEHISNIQGLLSGLASDNIRIGIPHDYLSSLARFFGVNARQDLNNIYINKADLIGLEPHSNNTAESLLVALLLRQKDYESNSLISTVYTSLFVSELIDGLGTNNLGNKYIRHILLVQVFARLNYSSDWSSYVVETNANTPISLSEL